MASINLKHTSGNGTILNSPAANPSADITLKLPSTTGSAGQVLKIASANHSSTNAELEFAADSGGKFVSYAVICDQKGNGDAGGTFTNGAFRTRDLNTELVDDDGIVSISSNQFTLQAGAYLINASAPAYNVNRHILQLYNVTDSNGSLGTNEFTLPDAQTRSFLSHRVTIGAAKAFEIRHRCYTSSPNTLGFGIGHDITGVNSIYTLVVIYKES